MEAKIRQKARGALARLKGVHIVSKKLATGERAFYFYAWRGGPRMHADPDDDIAMMQEYLRLTRQREAPTAVVTLADMVKKYIASADFTGLRDKTKTEYEAAIDRIEAKFFALEVAALEQRGARATIREWRDTEMGDRKRTADLTMAVFNKILNFAVDQEYITRNPLQQLAKLSEGTRRDKIWTDEQMAAFAASAPRHLVRAMILAKWTGQRQGDLLKLTWAAYDGSYLRLQQGKAGRGKAGRRVKIMVSDELKAVLDEIKSEQDAAAALEPGAKGYRPSPLRILTTEKGTPWKTGFTASWGSAVKTAKVSGVTFHDFRGTFITLAHRAGVLIKDIAEASGHDEKECERVIRQHYLATGSEKVIVQLQESNRKNARGTKL